MTIRTEPPGAELFVNDQRSGTTPYSAPFLWYGTYHFTMLKPGYERLDKRVPVRAPIYFWIPLDFIMELLPFPIRDDRVFEYVLLPSEPLPVPIPPEPEPTGSPGSAAAPTQAPEAASTPASDKPPTSESAGPSTEQPAPAQEPALNAEPPRNEGSTP
ncbi:MAG: PEGA domain-containing protein [Candidatus Omnitrophica bacterium]|nr:PEGA domain-containing protein [Candidatus Omnitrophota bacterium]